MSAPDKCAPLPSADEIVEEQAGKDSETAIALRGLVYKKLTDKGARKILARGGAVSVTYPLDHDVAATQIIAELKDPARGFDVSSRLNVDRDGDKSYTLVIRIVRNKLPASPRPPPASYGKSPFD